MRCYFAWKSYINQIIFVFYRRWNKVGFWFSRKRSTIRLYWTLKSIFVGGHRKSKRPLSREDTADRHCPESRDEPHRPRLITLIATNVTNVSKRYEPSVAPTPETFARRPVVTPVANRNETPRFSNCFVIAVDGYRSTLKTRTKIAQNWNTIT